MPVVEAIGNAHMTKSRGRHSLLAREMELAVREAIVQCRMDGITDPDLVRSRMTEARERAKRDFIA